MIRDLQPFVPQLEAMEGDVSVFARDLATGESFSYQPDVPLIAASVIKLPILITTFQLALEGTISMERVFTLKEEEKMPSCGALTYLHNGLQVTLRDLCVLMIIVSDNTATNMLIDYLGMDRVNEQMRRLGLVKTTLRRKLFDMEASARGLENHITAGEMALLLEKMHRGQCVSPEADAQMLSIMKDQQLNGKIPFFLGDMEVAHKTGESDGITHDVGVAYGDHPVIMCFASEHTCVPAFERLIQDMARAAVN